MPFQIVKVSMVFLLLGALGGLIGNEVKLPLPWMLGSLLITSSVCVLRPKLIPENYVFPVQFRMIFIAIIGVIIGSQVDQDLISQLPLIGMTLLGLSVFVPLAFTANIAIFQRLGLSNLRFRMESLVKHDFA